MIRTVSFILLALLLCAVSAEALVFDCKIEGRKGSDESTELLVCSVRQNGELIGTVLLRAPAEADPFWDAVIAPATVQAMRGDKVFLRLSCGVSPRIKDPKGYYDIVGDTQLRASEWRSLQVADVREITETQFLGVTAKQVHQ